MMAPEGRPEWVGPLQASIFYAILAGLAGWILGRIRWTFRWFKTVDKSVERQEALLTELKNQSDTLNQIKLGLEKFEESATGRFKTIEESTEENKRRLRKIQISTGYSDEEMKILLRQLGQATFRADSKGQWIDASDLLCRLFGMHLSDILGMKWLAAVVPADKVKLRQDYLQAIQDRTAADFTAKFKIFDRNQKVMRSLVFTGLINARLHGEGQLDEDPIGFIGLIEEDKEGERRLLQKTEEKAPIVLATEVRPAMPPEID